VLWPLLAARKILASSQATPRVDDAVKVFVVCVANIPMNWVKILGKILGTQSDRVGSYA
jgi:hypothetical protein